MFSTLLIVHCPAISCTLRPKFSTGKQSPGAKSARVFQLCNCRTFAVRNSRTDAVPEAIMRPSASVVSQSSQQLCRLSVAVRGELKGDPAVVQPSRRRKKMPGDGRCRKSDRLQPSPPDARHPAVPTAGSRQSYSTSTIRQVILSFEPPSRAASTAASAAACGSL